MESEVEYLRECFQLNMDEWVLYWKVRPSHHFANEQAWSRFNTLFANKRAGFEAINSGIKYCKVKLDEKSLFAHRVIWALLYNEIPQHPIDHIDGDGVNNNPENLRLCVGGDGFNNSRNRKLGKNNTSGRTGVYWRKERCRWVAKGRIYNKDKSFTNFNLGSFVNFEDAVAAREAWEIEYGFDFRESTKLK